MSQDNEKSRLKISFETLFHKVFSPSHIVYSLVYFSIIIIIALLSFSPSQYVGNGILLIATSFAITYVILMLIGIFPKMSSFLFSTERKLDPKKIIVLVISFGISFIILLIYFLLGSSTQLPIEFLGWDILLPSFFIVIYFAWNLVQIVFLKTIFEDISVKANNKFIINNTNSNKDKLLSLIFLLLGIIFPILIQLGTYFGFAPYFEPQNPGDPLDPVYWFNAWNIVMYIIIILTSWRLITLYIKSKKNNTPNIFSSIFYILIWLIIWYRSFSFVYSFRTVTQTLEVDIFRVIIDVLLMIFTAVMVLRGLGSRILRFRIFNENNLAFFLFAFTILYIEGQVIMITGAGSITGAYTSRSQINLVNNFLILLVTIIFYWWYSEYILERKGLIFKKNFKQQEVIVLIKDFKDYLVNSGALDSDKINEWELNNFLRMKNLTTKGIESSISSEQTQPITDKPDFDLPKDEENNDPLENV